MLKILGGSCFYLKKNTDLLLVNLQQKGRVTVIPQFHFIDIGRVMFQI